MDQPTARDRVSVGWEEARAVNRANWDDRVPIHLTGYGIEPWLAEPARLTQVVATDLAALAPHLPAGSVAGLDLCHLQCHIGTDTISFARAGARVTGVDFSAPALAAARDLAARAGVQARWVEADVLDAHAAVTAAAGEATRFDVIYTSIGAICWLNDLATWARQVAALLRPGGVFYIRDGHPALNALDEIADGFVTRYRYFGDGTALEWEDSQTYLGEGTVAHPRTYEWPHPISEVVTSLLDAGLTLVALDEGKTLPWRFADRMIERPDGDFEWPAGERDLVPCTFTVVARRPE